MPRQGAWPNPSRWQLLTRITLKQGLNQHHNLSGLPILTVKLSSSNEKT